MIETFLFVKLG